MSKNRKQLSVTIFVLAITIFVGCFMFQNNKSWRTKSCTRIQRQPEIKPDYSEITIPPNIAPLNFRINETGDRFVVKLTGENGNPVEIRTRTPQIIIPIKAWKIFLEDNKKKQFKIEVFARQKNGKWKSFRPISNKVSEDMIDKYLVYRQVLPLYSYWRTTQICIREMETYKKKPLLRGQKFHEGSRGGCVNCHSFCNNSGQRIGIGVRDSKYGSSELIVVNGVSQKLDTKFGYTSWHPNGQMIVYSINKVRQFFHEGAPEVRDVIDMDSALLCYDVNKQKIKPVPDLAIKDQMETYPTWSADGKWLYYCSAPILWKDKDTVPPERYNEVRYNLMRISYDENKDEWGKPEMILSAKDAGGSILLPRVSPDNRYLLFCICDYGCFPVFRSSSDLYIMDLDTITENKTAAYKRLSINSEQSESWHSWSSNGRWIAFSSKRIDGLFTRTYMAHVDNAGHVSKPWILPQKDPCFYDGLLKTFSVPELINTPVSISEESLVQAATGQKKIPIEMPITGATPKTTTSEPWKPAH